MSQVVGLDIGTSAVRAAELGAPADGERLRSLAGAAEAVRFAATPVPELHLRASVAAGHELLERISRSPA